MLIIIVVVIIIIIIIKVPLRCVIREKWDLLENVWARTSVASDLHSETEGSQFKSDC